MRFLSQRVRLLDAKHAAEGQDAAETQNATETQDTTKTQDAVRTDTKRDTSSYRKVTALLVSVSASKCYRSSSAFNPPDTIRFCARQ